MVGVCRDYRGCTVLLHNISVQADSALPGAAVCQVSWQPLLPARSGAAATSVSSQPLGAQLLNKKASLRRNNCGIMVSYFVHPGP